MSISCRHRAHTRAESAGFSTDEQNNIDIYKSARDATVFITSTVYTRSFFGVYPEKGTGTGFVISPEGRISAVLTGLKPDEHAAAAIAALKEK